MKDLDYIFNMTEEELGEYLDSLPELNSDEEYNIYDDIDGLTELDFNLGDKYDESN